jgi:2,3-bisphosphoglycerate-independent phosphoglycerate mutase
MTRPALLCILDGWGWRPEFTPDNAILHARAYNYRDMLDHCPYALLQTSGRAVGLPDGQMGNSEVGHMNIGSGRVLVQDLPRIDTAIADGALATRAALQDLIAKTRASRGAVHLMGLLSPGGVHSHQDHMAVLVKILSAAGVPVMVHGFLDGRDVAQKNAETDLKKFLADIAGVPGARLASLSGRYYAMDRDKRWDRVQLAYANLVDATGARFGDAFEALKASYDENVTDEFVIPVTLGSYAGMADGDSLLFANFRADRAREINLALLDPAFDGFKRERVVHFAASAGMTEYSDQLNTMMTALFPTIDVRGTLGEVVAEHGMKQLRIAETEKYAHVTFFLNGGREEPFAGEDRILVPSPKVATYDKQPEMSAREVCDKLVAAIDSGTYDLIVCNFANPDMVGHTGILWAAVAAVEMIDECLGRLRHAIEQAGGVMLVTADHGNIEMMEDPVTKEPFTAHTILDVPIIAVNAPGVKLMNGKLSDVAPTLLDLMGLPAPPVMSGHSLIVREGQS